MIKEVWMNLPVRNLETAKDFYTRIGFTPSENGNGMISTGFKIGNKNVVMMIFENPAFSYLAQTGVADTSVASEIMISLDTESREEIDMFADRVKNAGGTIFSGPKEANGWLYGFGFQDPDGHRWNVLYMDMTKI